MALIPRIVAGTARLGSVLPEPLARRSRRKAELWTLDALLDAGCRAFDLAASYQLGGTERLFGQWIASRRNRARLFLVGKGGHPYPGVQPNRLTRSALEADLHASLRRLSVEQIDLYLLHRDVPAAPLEPMVEALRMAHAAGKIGAWGVSNWSVPRIEAISAVARSAGLAPMAASSPHLSVAEWVRLPWPGSVSIAGPAQAAARAFHTRTQLPVLAWSPLASGFLTGSGSGSSTYRSAANLARRERVRVQARERGCTPAQVALAYCLSQPFPVSVVVAASTVEKMRENLQAPSIHLSAEEIRALEE